jgi:peroxiredoxin
MELYELLDTAVADLPELPDLVPEARRIHRRRTVALRGGALAAALAVGVGTLTIAAPWGRGTGSSAAGTAPGPSAAATATVRTPDTQLYGASYAAQYAQFPPNQRRPAPELAGLSLSGAALSTSYRGRVTVIVVWSSRCAPSCTTDAAVFAAAAAQDRAAGVDFYGIDLQDAATAAVRHAAEGFGFASFADPDGSLTAALSDFVPANLVPETVLVDANGDVAATITGVPSAGLLADQIGYARGR